MTQQEQYERMTRTPVHHLICSLAVPTIISMLVTNIYNMADTYFVSGLGTSASAATGVVFGLMAILQAFGFMFGHGAGSHISRRLGARDVNSARTYSTMSFYLSLAAGAVIREQCPHVQYDEFLSVAGCRRRHRCTWDRFHGPVHQSHKKTSPL